MEGPLTAGPSAATRFRVAADRAVDVLVVGAGPAGATAALVLARAGVDVALLDRAPLPRDKTCGGGVVARALEFLPPGVEIPVERRLGRVESRFVDAGVAVAVERDAPLVHMAMRAPLDLALAEAARTAGATLCPQHAVERIELATDHVLLETSRGAWRARFLVAADGATGSTARAAGWTEPLPTVPALEAEVAVAPSLFARHATGARFDLGCAGRRLRLGVPEGHPPLGWRRRLHARRRPAAPPGRARALPRGRRARRGHA